MGLDPVTLGVATLVGGSLWGMSQLTKKQSSTPHPSALPKAPKEAKATSQAKERIRRKTKTILTDPLTGKEYYGKKAPTLLGSGDTSQDPTIG